MLIVKNGLTLIELLVAMAMACLLVGIIFMVYGTTLNIFQTQTVRHKSLESAEEALDVIQQDILGSLALRGITNPVFVLHPPDEDRLDTLSLCLFTSWPGNSSNNWRAYGIHEVKYSLRAQSPTGWYTLVRQCRPFRIPDTTTNPAGDSRSLIVPAETTLSPLLANMQILVYNGELWTNAWETATDIPLAARIHLQIELPSGLRTITSETLIPAGHRIKAPAKNGQKSTPGIPQTDFRGGVSP